MHANNERPNIWKRVFRFLFFGIWESVYRRKKRRALFRSYTMSAPTRGGDRAYYTRYHWIKEGIKEGIKGGTKEGTKGSSREKNRKKIDASK